MSTGLLIYSSVQLYIYSLAQNYLTTYEKPSIWYYVLPEKAAIQTMLVCFFFLVLNLIFALAGQKTKETSQNTSAGFEPKY